MWRCPGTKDMSPGFPAPGSRKTIWPLVLAPAAEHHEILQRLLGIDVDVAKAITLTQLAQQRIRARAK